MDVCIISPEGEVARFLSGPATSSFGDIAKETQRALGREPRDFKVYAAHVARQGGWTPSSTD